MAEDFRVFEGDDGANVGAGQPAAQTRNLGPGITLPNPFAGITDFGTKQVAVEVGDGQFEYRDEAVSPYLWVSENLPPTHPLYQALVGHTSTDLQRIVGQDGNVYYQVSGKTGGPNRERYSQVYVEQGDKLVPVGEGKFYQGQEPDAMLKQFVLQAIPFIVSAVVPALAPIAAELGIPNAVLAPSITASLQIASGVDPEKAIGGAVAGYFGTNITPEVASVVRNYIQNPTIANIVAKGAEGAVKGLLTNQDVGLSALASATGQAVGGLVQQNINDPQTARQLASAVSMGVSAKVGGGDVASAIFSGLTKGTKTNVLENEDPFVASQEDIEQQGRLLTNQILANVGDLGVFPINIEGQESLVPAAEGGVGQQPLPGEGEIPVTPPEKIQVSAPAIGATLPTNDQILLQQIAAQQPVVPDASVEVRAAGEAAPLLPTISDTDKAILNAIAAEQGLPSPVTEPVVVRSTPEKLLPTEPDAAAPTPATEPVVVTAGREEVPSVEVTGTRNDLLPTSPVINAEPVEVRSTSIAPEQVEVRALRDDLLPTDDGTPITTEPVEVRSTRISEEPVVVSATRDDLLPTESDVVTQDPVTVTGTPIGTTEPPLPTDEQVILDSIVKEQDTTPESTKPKTSLLPTVLAKPSVSIPPGQRSSDSESAFPTRAALSEREGEDVYGTPEEEQEPVWNIRSLKLRKVLRI